MQLGEFLWTDRTLFDRRYEEDAAVYMAVVEALRAHRPLAGGEDEFLALHDFVSGADPDVFTTIWRDPYTHFWVRSTYALVGAVLRDQPLPAAVAAHGRDVGSAEPARVLRAHLEEYKRLALGTALLAGVDLDLPSPLDVRLPLAVPGLAQGVEGARRVRVAAVRSGALLDADQEALPMRACPQARVGDFALVLQPYGFHVPGMTFRPPAADTDLAYQAQQVPLLEAGLRLVQRHQPETLSQMGDVMRWIAVNPEIGDDTFASDSNLPGSFSLVCIRHPHVIASACIHEFHHNRLFFIEDAQPILAGEQLGTEDDALYYSPWRERPRPLRGLLHAIYVYVPEGRFWLSVATDPETDAAGRSLAIDRTVRIRLQMEIGIAQLERHGEFTEGGRPLFEQLVGDARAFLAASRAAALPDDVAAHYVRTDGVLIPKLKADASEQLTSRGVIAEHIELYDVDHQVDVAAILRG